MNKPTHTLQTPRRVTGDTMRQFARRIRIACALCAALALISCKTGPNYAKPNMEMPDRYKSEQNEAASAQTTPDREWWRLFEDPELDTLMTQALEANLDIKAAIARVEQSRATAASAKSSFFPTISLNPSATRSRTPAAETPDTKTNPLTEVQSAVSQVSGIVNQLSSLAQGNASGGSGGGGGSSQQTTSSSSASMSASSSINNRFQIPFDLSYEIDLWGRVRRSVESAEAQSMVSVHDLEVVRQTILADVARNYFSLRALDSQAEILARNLALYDEQLQLTRNQFKSGLANETNALQAEVQLETTRAQAADTQRQRADLEHAIAILLGRAPAQFSLEPKALSAKLPEIPAGAPVEILNRRPDIAEAEQGLISASADIGVAKAEFFPVVRINGTAGLQSAKIEDIFNWENRVWSIGPSVSLPIFQGGQLRAKLRKAKARYEEVEANYRSKVLGAFRDVEDSLTDLQHRGIEAEARGKATAAARENLRLMNLQYQAGISDYLNVISAEQSLLNSELSEIQLASNRMISTVLLVKAVGGGWEKETGPKK